MSSGTLSQGGIRGREGVEMVPGGGKECERGSRREEAGDGPASESPCSVVAWVTAEAERIRLLDRRPLGVMLCVLPTSQPCL